MISKYVKINYLILYQKGKTKMRKTLSFILALVMILSMSMISVYAEDIILIAPNPNSTPEGIAITTAAEFAAMAADGKYYLANDITIAEPYAEAFTGTLDGNGKTVTISQPMFVNFGGTIKNLTIEGSVTSLASAEEIAILSGDGARAAVAAKVACGTEVVFENITNNAAVSAIGNLSGDDCSGSMVGKIEFADVNVKFINVVNNATITGLNQVGGIVGWAKTAATVSFDNCINNGEIKETGSNAYCAGIICRSDAALTTYTACTNNARVSSGKDQAGGMIAYASKGSFEFTGCVNNGEIAPTVGKAGGLIGNINCNDADGKTGAYVTVKDCVNYGNVTAGGTGNYGAGIAACVQKTLNFTIENCVNYGEINGTHDSGGIMGHTTQAIMKISFCENFGKVTAVNGQYAGGICGYGWGTKTASVSAADGQYSNIIEYCINHADVTADTRAGGIVGSTGTTDARGIALVNYCINLGTVTLKATLTEENFSRHCAGGIMGYAWGTEDTAYPVITNCISAGNVIAQNVGGAGATAGYFLGYVNSTLAVVKNNIATGTLTSESGIYAALGRNNSHEFKAENMTGNALPEGAAYQLTYEATTDAAGAVVAITDKAYETKATDMNALTSGKYAYEFNQAYGSDVLFQTLDGTFAPTLEATGENSVLKTEDGFFNKLPEKPVEPAPTGDSAIIFAVIAVISILGVAVVAKRREF